MTGTSANFIPGGGGIRLGEGGRLSVGGVIDGGCPASEVGERLAGNCVAAVCDVSDGGCPASEGPVIGLTATGLSPGSGVNP